MSAPAAPAVMLTDRPGVEKILGQCGLNKRINVSRTTVVTAAEEEILTFCLNYATDYVANKVGNRYSVESIAASYQFYVWTSILAAQQLACFACGAAPASLQSLADAIIPQLEAIANGTSRPAGLRSLSGSGMVMDNVRWDPRYRVKTMRRESTISEGHSQPRAPIAEDVLSLYLYEPNRY